MKARIVVQMYGGLIDDIVTDDPNLELDVVFLEDPKYGTGQETEVRSGCFKEQIVYTHWDSINRLKTKDIKPAFAAAERREKALKAR